MYTFYKLLSSSGYDMGYGERGHAFESHAPPVFYFPARKYVTNKFKFLDFLKSLDRYKVLVRVINSEFYMAWRKDFTKIVPSLMSRLVKMDSINTKDFHFTSSGENNKLKSIRRLK